MTHDDILVLAGRRAAGDRLKANEQHALEEALIHDPDLALLILDAQHVASSAAPESRKLGRVTFVALVMGFLACFGLGATAGAQLAQGFVSAPSKNSTHQLDLRSVGDTLSLSLDAARKRK